MTTSSPLQRVSVNGTELVYVDRGTGEPVVLIPGGIIADAFLPVLTEPALNGRHRLMTYHRRGYGQSARARGPVSLAEQAADCRALLQHLGIERAHVAGDSFGGAIGLQLALDAPDVDLPALQQWSFTPAEARRITQPVLSVYHVDPAWAGFQQTHALLQGWLPQVEPFVLPDATHLLQVMQPQATAQALADFFARHPFSPPA